MLTEQGINYLSTQEGGKRMNYKEEQSKKKEILTELYENGVLEFARFNNISWEDYVSIVEGCQIDGYISGVQFSKGGSGNMSKVAYTDRARITEKGAALVEGKNNEEKINSIQNINFNGTVESAVIGNENTVNNTFNKSIEDFKSFVSELPPEEQATGKEILELTAEGKIDDGVINKFESFLIKYPKVIGFIKGASGFVFTNFVKLNML